MLTNLFTIFDPSIRHPAHQTTWVAWLRVGAASLVLFQAYWFTISRLSEGLTGIMGAIAVDIKYLFKKRSWCFVIVPLSLFCLALFSNLIGLLPYVFSATRHFSVTIRMALPVWAGLMIFRVRYHLKDLLAHLVPQGTPGYLIVFIVIIETIRTIIRPITLAVRLGANIIAGHLLLALLRGAARVGSGARIVGIGLGTRMLVVLEFAVSVIQAYVFATLVTLYIVEV